MQNLALRIESVNIERACLEMEKARVEAEKSRFEQKTLEYRLETEEAHLETAHLERRLRELRELQEMEKDQASLDGPRSPVSAINVDAVASTDESPSTEPTTSSNIMERVARSSASGMELSSVVDQREGVKIISQPPTRVEASQAAQHDWMLQQAGCAGRGISPQHRVVASTGVSHRYVIHSSRATLP